MPWYAKSPDNRCTYKRPYLAKLGDMADNPMRKLKCSVGKKIRYLVQ
jgi:hypothetical protein